MLHHDTLEKCTIAVFKNSTEVSSEIINKLSGQVRMFQYEKTIQFKMYFYSAFSNVYLKNMVFLKTMKF